jgi:hypothetical protein
MVIQRHKRQCPAVQNVGLNVRKLEEAAMKATSDWFSDAENPENIAKKPLLKEIFKVAKIEERYLNGEIGELKKLYLV